MPSNVSTPVPALDPATADPAVTEAIAALRIFGAQTRPAATRLLPWWRGYHSLTEAQRQAVLSAFPDRVTS